MGCLSRASAPQKNQGQNGEDAELWSHFIRSDTLTSRCLAFSPKSSTLLNALSRLRAVDSLMTVRLKWRCIDSGEKVDKYLDSRFCRQKTGFWNGPGRGVYTVFWPICLAKMARNDEFLELNQEMGIVRIT